MFEWLEARGGRWSQPSWPLAWGRKLADTDHGLSHVPSCSCRWHLRLLDTGYSAITLGVWYWTGIYIAFSQNASLFLEICLLSLHLTARAHTHAKTKSAASVWNYDRTHLWPKIPRKNCASICLFYDSCWEQTVFILDIQLTLAG